MKANYYIDEETGYLIVQPAIGEGRYLLRFMEDKSLLIIKSGFEDDLIRSEDIHPNRLKIK